MRMKKLIASILLLAGTASAQETLYQNPVDGAGYRAEWETYFPKTTEPSKTPQIVEIKSVRLLSAQRDFDENISVKELADFIKATQNNIEQSIDLPADAFELLVDAILTRDKDPEFQIASQGNVSESQLQKIYHGLAKLRGFRSKAEPLKYQTHFEVGKKN